MKIYYEFIDLLYRMYNKLIAMCYRELVLFTTLLDGNCLAPSIIAS